MTWLGIVSQESLSCFFTSSLSCRVQNGGSNAEQTHRFGILCPQPHALLSVTGTLAPEETDGKELQKAALQGSSPEAMDSGELQQHFSGILGLLQCYTVLRITGDCKQTRSGKSTLFHTA